jgi:hypothetical protein
VLRLHGAAPGLYMFPFPSSMKEMGSPEMLERYRRGPVGFLTVLPSGPPRIGRSLLQWFGFSVLVGLFVAYAAHLALRKDAGPDAVFRLTATVALAGYAFGVVSEGIWKGLRWGTVAKFVVDGVLYALATAAVFVWLWPAP